MLSQNFSQTLSFGFGSSPEVSPQKKTRQEEKQACLPVTIKTVLEAAGSASDEVRIHGEEVSMIMLVGVAESVVAQVTSVEFVLNDSSERLKIRQYLSTESHPIRSGQYVTVVGQIRMKPELHLSAQFAYSVDSPDQVSYHMIESAHAMLKLTRGKTDPMTPASKRPVATPQLSENSRDMAVDTPQKESKPAISSSLNNSVGGGSKLSGDALRSALISFLKQQGSSHPEGMEFADIARQMEPCAGVEIRKCLGDLVGEGEVYNTIDDDHFSAI